ncbi:MAG: anti-sigma factor [Gammaproteobacteria bacterium]|nr:anti-sigma factor [Gammaproteobacteria bacterium]
MNEHLSISAEELQAYVDGELESGRRDAVAAAAAADTALAKRIKQYWIINERLHGRYDVMLADPVPHPLLNILADRARYPGLRAAAVIAWIGLGAMLGVGVTMSVSQTTALRPLAEEAAYAHALYTRERRHAVEVTAVEVDHLNAWLSKRLSGPVVAPDIRDAGYTLIGGRLLPDAGVAAAQFMYEDGDGNRITLFVRQVGDDDRNTPLRYTRTHDVGIVHWLDGRLAYALAGGADKQHLLSISNQVHATHNR